MKFTPSFITVLKNFSSINQQMYFTTGTVQSTVVSSKSGVSFFARVKSDVEIDTPFAIQELHTLLNTIGLLTDPDIEVVDDRILKISDERRTVNYTLTRPEFIKYAENPDRFQVGEGFKIKLLAADLVQVLKMKSILNVADISLVGVDGKAYFMASNYKDPTGNVAKIEIGESHKNFRAVVKGDNLKMLTSDYDITVMPKGAIHFDNGTLEYFIPVTKEDSDLG